MAEKATQRTKSIFRGKKEAFSEWLENDYVNLKSTTKNKLEEKINGLTRDSHPWLIYRLEQAYGIGCLLTLIGISIPIGAIFFSWDSTANNPGIAPILVSSVGAVFLYAVWHIFLLGIKGTVRHQLESIYQSDGSQQIGRPLKSGGYTPRFTITTPKKKKTPKTKQPRIASKETGTIVVTCQECGQVFQVPDKLAGKHVLCEKCDAMFVIPTRATRHGMPAEDSSQGESLATKPSSSRSTTLYFVKKGDVVTRLSTPELRAAVANGEFAPDALIRKSEKDKWTTLSKVKDLDFKKPT